MLNHKKTTLITYKLISNEKEIVNGFVNNGIKYSYTSNSVSFSEERADKQDCLIASASGILTSLLDVFWVREFSLSDAQSLGRKQVNQFVIRFASTQGCEKNTLKDAIRFLENKYANPSDKLTSDFGGGLQHHLRDFSHHASPVGLMCSILVQFTGKGYGTDITGKIVSSELPENALIGNTFEEKIMYGIIYWAFHLVSDMAGSSSNAGAGTGIPGPLLSLLKELSALPIFQNKSINYKNTEILFSTWISKLFNGTAFYHTNQKDLIRFDLRTEIGITDFGVKQSVSVIINQCIVRSFYFLKRLCREIKRKEIKSIKELSLIEPEKILPFNNHCMIRMITVSSGTFTAIDAIDAAIRAKISSGNNVVSFTTSFMLHINFIGIANFAIAVKKDTKNVFDDIREAFTGENKKNRISEIIETSTININSDMDNTAIYRYRFDELLQKVKHIKKYSEDRKKQYASEKRLVFDIWTQDFDEYKSIVSYNESYITYTIERTILTIFQQNNIPYEEPKRINKHHYFSLIMREGNQRIGIIFALSGLKKALKDIYITLKENTDVDEVRFFFALSVESKSDKYIKMLNDVSREEYGCYLRFGTLKDFFDNVFRPGEYEIFKKYADDFNEQAQNIIAYKAIVLPTDNEIIAFREKTENMLKTYDYESMLPSDIFETQKNILRQNYLGHKTYKALLGNSVFADSFITSEWNYMVNCATGALDQTGIVTGYFKSIEQLLYAVILLSINQNRFICLKNGKYAEFNSDNKEYINNTLGSLTHYIKKNEDIFDVNNYVKRYIVDMLFMWIDNKRNGYFHKDNLHDEKKVDEIRNQTILLYYLILGGFTIKPDDYRKLGFSIEEKSEFLTEDELYQNFKKWVSPVIMYDIPKDAGAIGFMLTAFQGKHWDIALQAMSDSTETDYRWNWNQLYSTSYMANDFSWDNALQWNDGLSQVIRIVERFMQEVDPASKKLRAIPKIIIGGTEVYKTFLNE